MPLQRLGAIPRPPPSRSPSSHRQGIPDHAVRHCAAGLPRQSEESRQRPLGAVTRLRASHARRHTVQGGLRQDARLARVGRVQVRHLTAQFTLEVACAERVRGERCLGEGPSLLYIVAARPPKEQVAIRAEAAQRLVRELPQEGLDLGPRELPRLHQRGHLLAEHRASRWFVLHDHLLVHYDVIRLDEPAVGGLRGLGLRRQKLADLLAFEQHGFARTGIRIGIPSPRRGPWLVVHARERSPDGSVI
mmetsp:Transcript_170293/g.546225  ORF Transcript_170293/g.546225 Transcript_170293/m.546225 type:complete len:247 (+) Transcript_170293:1312-2052(+)